MAIHLGVVPPTVQSQLQQLSGGRQNGVVGGDDTLSFINEAVYIPNQIVDGDIDLDSILHPAPPVDCSTFRIISPVLGPHPSFSIHPFIHSSTHPLTAFSFPFSFPIPFLFYTHLPSVPIIITFSTQTEYPWLTICATRKIPV